MEYKWSTMCKDIGLFNLVNDAEIEYFLNGVRLESLNVQKVLVLVALVHKPL